MDINLTPKLQQKMSSRSRIRGRYNASEMYFIVNGLTTPEEWLNPSEKEVKEMITMWNGIGTHNQIQDLLGDEYCEIKREFVYRDIVLVGKADYLPPKKNEVWEIKTSEKRMKEMKPWHRLQTMLYCTMFEKEVGVIYQPVKNIEGIYLKEIGRVIRDDNWFQEELKKLYLFHLEIEKLWVNLKI